MAIALSRRAKPSNAILMRRMTMGLLAAASPHAISQAMAQSLPAGTVITTSGETATTVTPDGGNAASITTTTIHSRTGFNAFNAFTVGSDFTVNMVVPSNADRLVNVVRTQGVSINGIVNGYKGAVAAANRGGDIYFVAPRGFVVGANGVINVGALSVTTPTDSAANAIIGNMPGYSAEAGHSGSTVSDTAEIVINGRINAVDSARLRSKKVTLGSAATIATGVSALEAVDAQNAKIFAAVVNAQGLESGGAIVYRGGAIEIVGENAVDISGTARSRAGAGTNAGQVDIKSAGTIDVRNGASIVTDRNGGALAGHVTLTAEKRDADSIGDTTATTKVAIGGEIKSGAVTATAKASAITSYTNDLVQFSTTALTGSLAGLNGGYQGAAANARVEVTGTARVAAATELKLGAEATATTEMPVLTASSTSPFQAAVVAAILDSTAKVTVTGAAQLTAGTLVDITATNTSKVDVSAMALNTGQVENEKGAAAVGYGSATTRTEASVGADAVVDAQNVNVGAHNDHHLSVTATSMANSDGYAGVGFAMSEQDLETKASFAGTLRRTVGGVVGKAASLKVTALTDTEVNKTSGGTSVGNGIGGKIIVAATNAAGSIASTVKQKIAGKPALADAVSSGDANSHFRVGGGVSIALDKQVTEATVGAAGRKIDLTGDAIVAARTVDAGLRNNASAAIASNDEATKDNGATSVGVAAAVAYAEHDHTTRATVNTGAEIAAGRLALGAETIVPITTTWTRFDSVGQVLAHLNGDLGVANTVASSFTTATTAADDVGVSGSVNLNFLTGDTRAWVGENAKITVGAAGAGFADGIGMDWSSVADKALAVTALTRLESLVIGGQFSILLGGNEGNGQGGSKAVGGSYTMPSHAATTIAGIGAGVQVSAAGGVAVKAKTDDQLIVIAPSSGKGLGVGVAGLVNYAVIDNVTRAVISNQAKVDASSVELDADQDLLVVNVAAPLPVKAEGSAVGVGVAINDIITDTVAGIVDTSSITPNSGVVLLGGWTPYIHTSSLAVTASNDGWVAAFGLAGVSVDNDPDRESLTSKVKKGASETKLGSYFASATASDNAVRQKIGSLLQTTPTAAPTGDKASFSLGLAGSAAVNLTALKASALVEQATIDRYNGAGSVDVTVASSNTPITMTGAGAGAKVAAGGATSVGIGGAVAVDISESESIATIANSSVTTANDVRVRALNGGARVAAGLAVALNTPPANQKPGEAAAAVSASIVINRDIAQAHIDDSAIVGLVGGSGRDVEVTAYNAPKIGAGGGAGYEGGKMGLGLAVTVVDVGDNGAWAATEALIRDTSVTQVDTVTVNAADPSIILALSASGGKGAATIGIAGAGTYLGSSRTTRAGIGAIDGSSTISATGDVKVTATATRDAGLDALAAGRSSDLKTDVGYDFSAASTLGDLRSEDSGELKNANGDDLVAASGSAGVMIAAGGSGQKSGTAGENAKGNVGASFAGIFSSDVHEAFVDHATTTSDKLTVLAKDDAVRVGLAVGGSGGAEFGLTGSIAIVEDSGATRAHIGSATGARTTVNTGELSVVGDDASLVAALSGSFTMAGKAALGASVTHVGSTKAATSDITRSDVNASRIVNGEAILSGAIFNIAFSGAVAKSGQTPVALPDLDIAEGGGVALPDLDSGSSGGSGGGGGGGGDLAIGGASSSTIVTASARAKISDTAINMRSGTRAAVTLRGSDSQLVLAAGVGFARADKAAGGVGLVTNRRGGGADGVRTSAEIVGGSMDVANVLTESLATADIKSLAVGIAIGEKFAGGGSIVTNIVDGDVRTLVNGGASITAQNNAAVIAKSQDRLDVVGGGVGFSKGGAGLGISVVTNVMNADTIAAVEGAATRVVALGSGATGTTVVQGGLANTPDLTAIGEDQAGLRRTLGVQTVQVTGVAVNASSLNNVNIAALSVGAGESAGIGGNVATAVMGGTTEARIIGAGINQTGTAASRQQIDVAASDHTMVNSLVGAVGVSKTAGIAGGLDLAFLGRDVRAYASNAQLASAAATRIFAQGSQYTFGINVGLGIGKAGIAGAVSVTQFDANTEAYIDGGRAYAGSLDVAAVNKTGSTVATGVAAFGSVAVGGGVSVITSDNETLAAIGISGVNDTSLTSTEVRATTVNVSADREADLQLYSVGLAAGKVGVAGMGSVLLTSDHTRAGIFGGSVSGVGGGTATSLTVRAKEELGATIVAGAAAGGMVGVAGAVGVTVVANRVEAALEGTDTRAAGQAVEAISDRDIDAVTVSAGGGKVGVAASIGIVKVGTNGLDSNVEGAGDMLSMIDGLGNSDPANGDVNALLSAEERSQLAASTQTGATARTTGVQAANGTTARVLGSKIAGTLSVTSTDTTATRQDAGSLAGGLVGVGAGVAVTVVSNKVTALVDAASDVTGGGLSVSAKAQGQAIDNNAYVGAAGVVGVGAAVAVGTVENIVSASAGGTLIGNTGTADLLIDARDESSAKSKIYNVVAAGGAIGGTVNTLLKGGSVSAGTIGNARTDLSGFRSVIVSATSLGRVSAEGVGAAGGAGFAIQGSYVEAKDSVRVAATLGSGKYGYAATGIQVSAVRTPETFADVIGVTVGGMLAIGASVAKAEVDDDVTATVASGATLTNSPVTENGITVSRGSNLSVIARMTQGANDTARAEAQAGTGGGLIGADASVAMAFNTSNVSASTANGVKLGYGDVSIFADRQSSQKAETTGVSVGGLLALGATYSETKAGGSITATLGNAITAADGAAATLGAVSIGAGGKDVLDSASVAGSGGVIAGAASVAKNTHDASIVAQTADAATGNRITAGSFTLLGSYEAQSVANADSTQAAVLGGSGADARRTIDTNVTARIGTRTLIDTFDATIAAYQTSRVDSGGATAASGGLFNGAAGLSQTWITPEVKTVFGTGAEIDVIGISGIDAGRLSVQAANSVNARDSAKLDVGSGIPIAEAKTSIISDTLSAVDIGANVKLTGAGQIDIGAYSTSAVETEARISTYGGVGSAGGDSEALITSTHNVTLASGALVRGGDRVNIGAGTSGSGINATLNARAINDAYNWTAAPVNTRPDVKARATSNSTLTVASGATVESVRDVNLTSYEGTRSAYSDGTGHNPYLEIFSTTVDRSDHSDSGTGLLDIDGIVRAGIQAKQTVSIGANGTITKGATSGGISVDRSVYKVRSELQAKVDSLVAVDRTGLTEAQIVSLDGELSVFRQLLAEAPPEPLTSTERTAFEQRRADLQLDRARVAANQPQAFGEDGTLGTLTPQQVSDRLADIDAELAGISVQLSATTYPTTYSYTVGDIYAAAGDVTLKAKSLVGSSGSVTAEGGATIAITNATQDYLIVNNLYIPDGDGGGGGHVRFEGGAAAPGSLTVRQIDTGQLASIRVENNATAGKAGIFLTGAISNIGGGIEVINQTGSIAQFAPVAGRTLSITAPNGTYAVNLPNGIFHAGAAPEAAWRPYALLPGSAADAAFMVANYLYNRNPDGSQKTTDSETFTRMLMDRPGSCGTWAASDRCIAPVLFYDMINRKNADDADFRWAQGSGSFFSMKKVPVYSLTKAGTAANMPLLDAKDGITARTLIVNARDINITAPAKIGRNNNYSLNVSGALDGDIAAIRAAAQARGVALTGVVSFETLAQQYGSFGDGILSQMLNTLTGRTSITNVGLRAVGTLASSDERIGVAYDFDNNRLITSDVDGAGGGSIKLTGRIFSTTTYGSLQVNNGFGDIRVTNDSNAGLLLGNIDTGRGSVGRIQITDLAKTGYGSKPLTSWYIYENAGNQLSVYNNALTGADDYLGLTPISIIAGRDSTYNPAAGYRYQWSLSRSAKRYIVPGMYNDQFAVYRQGVSDWVWNESDWAVSGQSFYYSGQQLPVYQEDITGFVTRVNQTATGTYNLNFTTSDGGFAWGEGTHGKNVTGVTGVRVTANISVKADNPIGINFTGNATANVNVQSRGAVTLTGNITNPTGTTTIGALGGQGGLTSTGGTIETSGLSLSGRSIGATAGSLGVVMNGTLNATATAGDIGLAISGLARIGTVSATGVVRLSAVQGIVGNDSASSITGRNLDLSAAAGAITGVNGSALTINAVSGTVNGNTVGGELTAAARDSINLRQASGNLRLKSIASELGDVTLDATAGSLTNAIAEFTVDEANQIRLANVWSDLGLTDPNSVLRAVASFERDIRTQQAERARILNQVTLVDGTVTAIGKAGLTSEQSDSARAIYVAQTKASLGLATDPSDAQVIAYVQGRYRAIEDYATSVFGSDRPAGFDSTDLSQSFAYSLDPASARYQELTRGVWSETQLAQSISGTALIPVNNTTILQQAPNVRGRNITLKAAAGSIGQNLASVEINAQAGRLLTTAERATLAAAGPGDIRVEDLANGGKKLVISQQRMVNVSATGTVTAIAQGDLYLGSATSIAAADLRSGTTARINLAGSLTNAAAIGSAAVRARDLLLEASGGSIGTAERALSVQVSNQLLSARAGGDVRIEQRAGDLTVGVGFANNLFSLTAASGSILSAFGNTDEVRLQGGSIRLVARDYLGRSNARLQIQVAGNGSLTGSASDASIYSPLAALTIGDMAVARDAEIDGRDLVFRGGFTANTLRSAAASGTITVSGALSAAQHLALSARGIVVAGGGSVRVTGAAPDTMLLHAGTGGLVLGQGGAATVSSLGDIDLRSGGALSIDGSVTGRGVDLDAAGPVRLRSGAVLEASGTGMISSGALTLDDDVVLNLANGVLAVSGVFTAGSGNLVSGDTITVGAGSMVLGVANRFAATGALALHSAGAISAGDGFVLSGTTVDVAAGGALTIGDGARLAAATGLRIAGQDIFLGDDAMLAGTTLAIESAGDLTVGDAASLTAASTWLDAASIAFGRGGTLTAAGALGVTTRSGDARFGDGAALSGSSVSLLSAGKLIAGDSMLASATGALAIAAADAFQTGDFATLESKTADTSIQAASITLGSDTLLSAATALSARAAGGDARLGDRIRLTGTSIDIAAAQRLALGDAASLRSTAGTVTLEGAAVAFGNDTVLAARGALAVTSRAGGTTFGKGAMLDASTLAVAAVDDLTFTDGAALNAGGNLLLTSGNSTALGANAQLIGATIALDAAGALTLGDAALVEASGALSLTAGDALALGAGVTATSSAGGITLEGALVTIGDHVALAARDALAITSRAGATGFGANATVDAGTLGVTAAGSLDFADRAALNAAGAIALASGGSTVLGADSRVAGRTIAVDAGQDVTLGDRAQLVSGGALSVAAARAIAGGTDMSLRSGGAMTLTASTIALGGDALLSAATALSARATVGDAAFGANATLTGATVALDAAGALTLGNGATVAGSAGDLSLAGAAVTIGDDAALSARDALAILSRGGATKFGKAATLDAATIAVGASGDLAFADRAALHAAGAIALASGGSTVLGADSRGAGRTIAVDAGQDVTLGDRAQLVSGGALSVAAARAIAGGTDMSVRSGGAMTLTASTIALGSDALLSAATALSARATGGDAAFGANATLTGATVALDAAGALTLGNGATVAGSAGDLSLAGASVTIGDDAALSARDALAIVSRAGAAKFGKAATLDAATIAVGASGDLAFADRAALDAVGAIALASGGSTVLGADSRLAGRTIAVDAGQDVTLGDRAQLVSGGALSVAAARVMAGGTDMSLRSGGAMTLTASTIALGSDALLSAATALSARATVGDAAYGANATLTGETVALDAAGALTLGNGATVAGSAGDLSLAGASVTIGDDAVLGARDALAIVSRGGATRFGANATVDAGTLGVTAAGSLAFADRAALDAAGAIALASGGSTAIGADARLAGRTIAVDAGRDALLGARAHLTSGDTLSVKAAGAMAGGADISLRSGGAMALAADAITFGSGLDASARGTMAFGAVAELRLDANAALEATTLSLAGDRITVLGNARIDGRNGIVAAADALTFGDGFALASADGDAVLKARVLQLGTDGSIASGGALALTGRGRLDAGDRLNLTASEIALSGGAITIGDALDVASRGSIVFAATGGNFGLGKQAVLAAGTDIVVEARQALDIGSGLRTNSGGSTSLRGANVAIGAASMIEASSLTIAAAEGDLTVGTGSSFGVTGGLALDAVRAMRLDAGVAIDAGQAMLGADSVAIGEGVRIDLAAKGAVTARNGDIVAAGASLRGDALSLHASRNVTLERNAIAAASLDVGAGRDVTLDRSRVSADSATIGAGGSLDITAGRMSVSNGLILDAVDMLRAGGDAEIAAGRIRGTATTIEVSPARLTAATTVDLSAAQALMMGAGSVLASGGATAITANDVRFASGTRVGTGSDLSIRAGATLASEAEIDAVASITLDAGGTLTLADATAGGSIVATSGGTAEFGRIESLAWADDAIRLTSGGTIEGRSGVPLHIAARTGGLVMRAEGDIGTRAVPLQIDVRSLNATSLTGSVAMRGIGPLKLTGAALAGSFTIEASGGLWIENFAAKSVEFASGGAFSWSGGAFETGTIRADGGIAADGLQIARSLAMFGPTIDVQAEGVAGSPLRFDVAGIGDRAQADSAKLRITGPVSVTFGTFLADMGRIDADTPSFEIADGVVGTRLDLTLPEVGMLITRARTRGEQVTIQARAATGGYGVKIDGRRVVTDAAVMGGLASRSDGGYIDPSMLSQQDSPAAHWDAGSTSPTGAAADDREDAPPPITSIGTRGNAGAGGSGNGSASVRLPDEANDETDIQISDSADGPAVAVLASIEQ